MGGRVRPEVRTCGGDGSDQRYAPVGGGGRDRESLVNLLLRYANKLWCVLQLCRFVVL